MRTKWYQVLSLSGCQSVSLSGCLLQKVDAIKASLTYTIRRAVNNISAYHLQASVVDLGMHETLVMVDCSCMPERQHAVNQPQVSRANFNDDIAANPLPPHPPSRR